MENFYKLVSLKFFQRSLARNLTTGSLVTNRGDVWVCYQVLWCFRQCCDGEQCSGGWEPAGNLELKTYANPVHSRVWLVFLKPWYVQLRGTQSLWASLVAQKVKNLPAMWDTWVRSLGWEDPLEKGMTTHSSTLAWRIPWTEEPGGP